MKVKSIKHFDIGRIFIRDKNKRPIAEGDTTILRNYKDYKVLEIIYTPEVLTVNIDVHAEECKV